MIYNRVTNFENFHLNIETLFGECEIIFDHSDYVDDYLSDVRIKQRSIADHIIKINDFEENVILSNIKSFHDKVEC